MMKILISILLFVTFLPAQESKVSKEDMEKASYAIGFDLGQNMNRQGLKLILEMLKKGLDDGYTQNDPLFSKEERDNAIMRYYSSQRAAENKETDAEAEKNLAAAKKFLAANRAKEGVMVTESGLQYLVIQSGRGPSPEITDEVEVHYRGTLIDGKEFDSSYKRNSTSKFVVNQVVPGWQEALPMMRIGDKWRIFIPPHLGYGNRKHPVIPRNSALIFEVELISISGK